MHFSDEEVFVQDAGSLGYKAPEVIRTQPSDFKSDIWSLGCILYDLLCGQMPFLGNSIDQVNHRILYKELLFEGPIWDTVSDECIDLIKRMLCKDQEARYDIADVLMHPWVYKIFEKKGEKKTMKIKAAAQQGMTSV